ncbi:MAG: HupE/UreJ family protein [Myxococcota bacterium]|jgi:hypothetical protein|nr:HupE/UreJ family protein [Myxococcota bacterium]
MILRRSENMSSIRFRALLTRGGVLAALALLFALATAATAPTADAHPLAPSLLELREQAASEGGEVGSFDVRWKTPSLRAPGVEIDPVLPAHCNERGERRAEPGPSHVEFFWQVNCGEAGLTGATLSVTGLDRSRTTALVRVVFADGKLAKGLVRADAPDFEVASGEGVAAAYALLGFEHILLGPDHLLFVLGLMLLIRGMRKLVGAITFFTVGHSITLALAILDWVRVPQSIVEVGIAISLVVVALELVKGDPAPGMKESWLRLRPWLASFGFGLLHGLGFAGALRETGLPSGEIPLALFFFNVGIEIGQLVFIAAVWVVIRRLSQVAVSRAWVDWGAAYAIGTLSVFWVIERSVGLF